MARREKASYSLQKLLRSQAEIASNIVTNMRNLFLYQFGRIRVQSRMRWDGGDNNIFVAITKAPNIGNVLVRTALHKDLNSVSLFLQEHRDLSIPFRLILTQFLADQLPLQVDAPTELLLGFPPSGNGERIEDAVLFSSFALKYAYPVV